MKKFFAFLIAGVLVLSMAGCGNKDNEPATPDPVSVTDEVAEEVEEVIEEEPEEVAEEPEEEPLPEVTPPEDIAALGYDKGYIINEKNMLCVPYNSEKYTFSDKIVPEIKGDGHSIYSFAYEFAGNMTPSVEGAIEDANESEDGKVEELTIGDFSVTAVTTKPYFVSTTYYIDFNGKFGEGLPCAFFEVSESRQDLGVSRSAEIEDMIANIFIAE